MSVVADMQWCFPFRRQHFGVSAGAEAKAIGANSPQPISDNTKLATNRRILDARYHITTWCDNGTLGWLVFGWFARIWSYQAWWLRFGPITRGDRIANEHRSRIRQGSADT